MRKKINKTTSKEQLEGLVSTRKFRPGEEKKAKYDLTVARERIQKGLSSEDRLAAKFLQFKLKLHEYLSKDKFSPKMTFSYCLTEYVDLQEKKRKAFAEEIDLEEAELSLFINAHRTPPEYLIIRLEIHSNNSIPANWWFKLIEKEREHAILTDTALRKEQRQHVHKRLEVNF